MSPRRSRRRGPAPAATRRARRRSGAREAVEACLLVSGLRHSASSGSGTGSPVTCPAGCLRFQKRMYHRRRRAFRGGSGTGSPATIALGASTVRKRARSSSSSAPPPPRGPPPGSRACARRSRARGRGRAPGAFGRRLRGAPDAPVERRRRELHERAHPHRLGEPRRLRLHLAVALGVGEDGQRARADRARRRSPPARRASRVRELEQEIAPGLGEREAAEPVVVERGQHAEVDLAAGQHLDVDPLPRGSPRAGARRRAPSPPPASGSRCAREAWRRSR